MDASRHPAATGLAARLPAGPTSTSTASTASTATAAPAPPAIPAARTPTSPRARTARPAPELRGEYAHLDLDALRSYRTALQAEENKVSYWRRIIQARLDVVRDGRTSGGTGSLDAAHLRPVLADRRVSAGRRALVEVVPVDDIPPLPDLAELWERQVAPADAGGLEALERDLATAETQLSSYRTALHRQLGEATGELIARYRGEPTSCLTALPLRPGPRRA